MATKDVPRAVVLQTVADYKKLNTNQQILNHVVHLLMERTGQCEKVVYAALHRDYAKGYIEYGVSIRRCWLTQKGIDALALTSKE
jgi:hypothetical protein